MRRFLSGLRDLIPEDSYWGAMAARELVAALGGEVIRPVAGLHEAGVLFRQELPDGGILDITLDGSISYPLAQEMIAAGAAVVFLTGYEISSIKPEFSELPRISKPFNRLGAIAVLDAKLATV